MSKSDETSKIMADKELYRMLQEARKKGSKTQPYVPLVSSKTRIIVFNDTKEELVIRLPPTATKLEPKKMKAIFLPTNDVFFKIWDGNVIMFQPKEKVKQP